VQVADHEAVGLATHGAHQFIVAAFFPLALALGLCTEKLYTPFFPHLNHHHTTMSNLEKTFKLQAALLQLSRKMKDINILQDLQGLSDKTYNKILRLAEKHGLSLGFNLS